MTTTVSVTVNEARITVIDDELGDSSLLLMGKTYNSVNSDVVGYSPHIQALSVSGVS